MLTVDIAVNMETVARVAVFNRGAFSDDQPGLDVYEYRVDRDSTWSPAQRTSGRLTHWRDEGAYELVRKVMAELVR